MSFRVNVLCKNGCFLSKTILFRESATNNSFFPGRRCGRPRSRSPISSTLSRMLTSKGDFGSLGKTERSTIVQQVKPIKTVSGHSHSSFATRFGPKAKCHVADDTEEADSKFDNFFQEVDLDKIECCSSQQNNVARGIGPVSPGVRISILKKGIHFFSSQHKFVRQSAA